MAGESGIPLRGGKLNAAGTSIGSDEGWGTAAEGSCVMEVERGVTAHMRLLT